MRPTIGTPAVRPANPQSIIGAAAQEQATAEMQRKGAMLSRHYSPNTTGPLTNPLRARGVGLPSARRLGENAPTTPQAAQRLHDKGQRLLNQARRLP